MTNENVKTQVINDVIVAMSAYIAADLIQILERVIVDKKMWLWKESIRYRQRLRIVWINRMST